MDIPPEVSQAAPGTIGSAIATARWVTGSLTVRIIALITGSVAAYFITTAVLLYWGLSERWGFVVGFFAGLFGGPVLDKVQEFVRALNVADLWAWVRKRLGVGE